MSALEQLAALMCAQVFQTIDMCIAMCQVPREFPFDGLKEELGGGFGPAALEERMGAGIPHAEEDE